MTIYRSLGKDLLDFVLSVALFAALLPLLVVTALLVWFTMGRPVLFCQRRAGRNGRIFTILKFRTMKGVPSSGPTDDDARLTTIGRLLRATSIDELPELVNVIRGEMSLVGPRPLLPHYLPRYSPTQARRHEVKPGITGWAQVNGRNSLSWEQRFALDVWYVENFSLALDATILVKTLIHTILRKGIHHEGHATMPEFGGE